MPPLNFVDKIPKLKPNQLLDFRKVNRIAANALAVGLSHCKTGNNLNQVDNAIHEYILAQQAWPTPNGFYGFPKSVCATVNEVITHGVPSD
mmetsp:Transcript_85127/g.183526  ORF Transcript_85127/g.183526 Transcript_85127/m.183526 type:complete len:91 (+) Transcript_85127:102-374(+)